MMTNINPETGVRFGTIYLNNLDPDTASWLWDEAENISERTAYKELKAEVEREADALEEECAIAIRERDGNMPESDFQRVLETEIEAAYGRLGYQDRDDFIETENERRGENMQIEEPYLEGECEGVKYGISHLGGAGLLWVYFSPHVTRAKLCSPCVPNAGDLDSRDPDGYECYDVPEDWRARDID